MLNDFSINYKSLFVLSTSMILSTFFIVIFLSLTGTVLVIISSQLFQTSPRNDRPNTSSDESSQDPPKGKVAVIGLGISGLASLKNLLEQGFDVVGLERNDYIGGIWEWTDNTKQTSVLKTTVANSSKQFGCFTDFPFADDIPDYPSASDVSANLRAYADYFSLHPHIKTGVNVLRIERSGDGQAWDIHLIDKGEEKTEIQKYDKVMICTGPWERSWKPTYKDEAMFQGRMIVGKEYKGPQEFKDLKVVVVGMANTACDIAVDLVGNAKEVYISHRSGTRVVPRMMNGKPTINSITRQLTGLMSFFDKYLPSLGEWGSNHFAETKMLKSFPNIKPEWKLLPAPSFKNTLGVINDRIIGVMETDHVQSLGGIESFTSDGIITDQGRHTPADVVIFCTGSYFDFSILSDEANPTTNRATHEWDNAEHSNGLRYPRLYQTLFHPDFAESLAFLGPCRGFSFAVHTNADLASQAIAQVWKNNHLLPSALEMNKWCDGNYQSALKVIKKWRTFRTGHSNAGDFEYWLNDVAGTGVNEHLGYTSLKGWSFWWKDRKLYNLIMNGVNTPFVYRLFDGRQGGRKKWNGARNEICKANGVIFESRN
ncbi:uncharacterized protein IL334_002992 [Kwoniella shivajii]|uniref:Uncharacterized protein n=1 Tax=Kwoniella shivajii TaxID=564305 RepID=A0ABZ1CWA0_9TREE|nr:hypothetical protein IL334_002992 [Kwoniella shivajii]